MKLAKLNTVWLMSWAVATVAILGIALVLAPDAQHTEFWVRVGWMLFLNILFWYGVRGWFSSYNNNSDAALTPALSVVTTVYCVASAALLIGFYPSEMIAGCSKVHIITQIVFFALYLLVMLQGNLVRIFADDGLNIPQNAADSTTDLATRIRLIEQDLNPVVAKEMQKLREGIMYQLQNNAKLRTNPMYKKFVKNVYDMLAQKSDIQIADIQKLQKDISEIKISTKGH